MIKALATALTLVAAVPALGGPCGDANLFETLTDAEAAQIEAVVAVTPFASGTLWQGTKGDDRVTVVGTMHIPDSRLEGMTDQVRPILKEADILVIEATKADELRLAGLAAEEPDLFFLNEGPSLMELLGPEDWARAEAMFDAAGIPRILGAKFRPWYASMIVGLPECVTLAMVGGEVGLDRRLEKIATDIDLPVVAIEDGIEVLRTLMGENDAEDLEALRFALRSEISGEDTMATMIEAYFDGRVAAVWELGRILSEREMPGEGGAMFDAYSVTLLEDRNRAWERDLPGLITGRDAIIAVGAAHLPGETGVLRSLERMGYEISPLP